MTRRGLVLGLSAGLNAALVVAVIFLALRGNDTDGDVCGSASEWREATQAWLATSNAADRDASEGLERQYDAYLIAATIVLPPLRESAGDLVKALHRSNVEAERWLSAVTALGQFFGGSPVSGITVSNPSRSDVLGAIAEWEDSRLVLNQALREVNSLLVADCGIEPMELVSAIR